MFAIICSVGWQSSHSVVESQSPHQHEKTLVGRAAQLWCCFQPKQGSIFTALFLTTNFILSRQTNPPKQTLYKVFLESTVVLGQTQGSKAAPLKQCSPHPEHVAFGICSDAVQGLYLTLSLEKILRNYAFYKNPKAAPQPTRILLGMLLFSSRQPLVPAEPKDAVP